MGKVFLASQIIRFLKMYYLKKEVIDEIYFCIQINIEVLYKLILSFWVCVIRHVQSTQNKKFAYLCNISRKIWGMKLIFCLQINTNVFYKLILLRWVFIARHVHCPKVTSLQYLCNISRKKWRMKLIFCPQINIRGFFKLLDKLQKLICRTVGPSLAASLEPLILHQNVAILSLFCRYYFGRYSSELAQLVLLPYSRGRSSCYPDSLHDFSVTIPRC